MKVGGFGELENIRKAIQKEEPKPPARKETSTASESGASRDDAALVSNQARDLLLRDRMNAKLKQLPDIREDKVKEVLSRLNSGELMTPNAVKDSIARMLDRGIPL